MRFIQFGMLGLGALAIPVIIHLLFRTHPRTVDLGTLQFLRIVLHDNARKRRLKCWCSCASAGVRGPDRLAVRALLTYWRSNRARATGSSWC